MKQLRQPSADTQNETRENTMIGIKKQKSTGFLSVTCKLFFATCLALFLAPSNALADNECGIQVGTTHVVCDQSSYGNGVTYNALGDLFIDFTASPTTEVESGGIDLSATGGDSIFFDSQSTNTEIESRAVTGPLLSVTTVDGNIDIDTEEMDGDGQTPNGVTHAIHAVSGGGDIDINTSGIVDVASGANPEDSIGIEAVTGGSGALTITVSGAVRGNDAAIDATTDTGDLVINIAETGSSATIDGGSGSAIRTDVGGDAVINIASSRIVSALDTDTGELDLNADGETTVNNAGRISASGSFKGTAIRAAGGAFTLNNDGNISGGIDTSALSDGFTFNNNAGASWRVGMNNNLGAGVFNNAGTIELGIREAVLAPGTTFTGTGDSVLEMRAALIGTGQISCTNPTAASCLDLTGGSTSGQTSILLDVNTSSAFDPSGDVTTANSGIVLVDVSGGTSDADHFVLHPDMEGYAADPKYGAVLDTGGLLDYALLYNPNTQEHVLTTVPQQEGVEYVAFIHEALSIWHTTSDAVAGRQADLRGGAVGGGWARLVSGQTERDSVPTLTTQGNSFTYEQDYTLDTWSAIGGYDLTSSDNHVIGLHGGFVYSTLEFDNSNTGTRDKIKGATMGAYAGWWNEAGLTLDGTLNTNFLRLKHNVREEFERSTSDVRSVGVRAEAGWLLSLADEAFFVQPLVTAAYVRSNIELLELRQNKLRFEDEESRRAALGVRLGGDMDLSGNRFGHLKYWLTARAWEEYAEDASVNYLTEGEPLTIEDDISESFEEVGLGVSLTSPDDKLNVFLSGGLQSGDQTDSTNVTIGVRMNW